MKFQIGDEVFLRSNSPWKYVIVNKKFVPIKKIVNGKSMGLVNVLEYALTSVDDFKKKSHNNFDGRICKVMEHQIIKSSRVNKRYNAYRISSSSTSAKMLTQIPKLKKVVKKKKRVPLSLKKMVWDHYYGSKIGEVNCPCCNYQKIRQIDFHCAHIKAFSKGGETKLPNLIPCCALCNGSMQTLNFHKFKKTFF